MHFQIIQHLLMILKIPSKIGIHGYLLNINMQYTYYIMIEAHIYLHHKTSLSLDVALMKTFLLKSGTSQVSAVTIHYYWKCTVANISH